MTVTLAPETETRLRTMAEGFGLEPAVLHADLLQQALADAEAEPNEKLAGLDESAEAIAAGRWITREELDQRMTALRNALRAGKLPSQKSEPAC